MARRTDNTSLRTARKTKNDEFYTQYADIENEVVHYTKHFENKIVCCNCDDYTWSNFFKYFDDHFAELKLKKLICTCYNEGGKGLFCIKDNKQITEGELNGNGDFRSDECIELLKSADIVVTNPPFSLFREYIAQLMEYDKKFLILGNMNAVTYKEIYPLFRDNKVWMGYKGMGGKALVFQCPEENYVEGSQISYKNEQGCFVGIMGICWFTNLEHDKRTQPLELKREYIAEDYPKYDNYDAIEIARIKEIPKNYNGVMGVPISFLDRYCPTQFEIISLMSGAKGDGLTLGTDGKKFSFNGKGVYARLLISAVQR